MEQTSPTPPPLPPPHLGLRILSRVLKLLLICKSTVSDVDLGWDLNAPNLQALNTGPSGGGLPGRPVVEQNRKVVSLRKSDVPHPRPPPRACRGGGCGFQPPTIPARARPRRSPATRTRRTELLVSGVPPRLLQPSPPRPSPATRAAAEGAPPLPAARPCTPARSRGGPQPQGLLLPFLSRRCSLGGAVRPA